LQKIVFVFVADPVASGFVASLSHPGGNITGFYWWQAMSDLLSAADIG